MRKIVIMMLVAVAIAACSGQKRLEQYKDIYSERPSTIYVAPVDDRTQHKAVRETKDSIYNASISIAAKQLYLTAADPLTDMGYYVLGPLASAHISATETRSGKELRNGNINDYASVLGIDAVLFIDLISWGQTSNSWTAEIEYLLRSTRTGAELMHVRVNATKFLYTDHKGNPKPLADDLRFAEQYGCDMATAQRCRLVEITNQYVLRDLPSGERARSYDAERHVASHPDFFYLRIQRDGSVEMFRTEDIERSNAN